jgi:hypothetical protein
VRKQYALLIDDELLQERRSDFDVTNTVKVSAAEPVRRAVHRLFQMLYPSASFDAAWIAFHDFERLYTGQNPDYHGVDTTYHDMQHTLDMTLAMARLIAGYEFTAEPNDRLGPSRALFGIVSALFHDAGYLRHRERDANATNGAEFTRTHVARGGRYLEGYLPEIGLGGFAAIAAPVLHFTGYEMSFDEIELDDPKESTVGHLLGTADLLAQLSDRCYLEKCRDRLYPEFVLGEVAVQLGPEGPHSLYESGRDLLAKTMDFYQTSAQYRLEHSFNRAYRYVEALYGEGENPYMSFIHKNFSFLLQVKESGTWDKLRRHPPCVIPDPYGEARLMALALKRLREVSEFERANSQRLRALNPAFTF